MATGCFAVAKANFSAIYCCLTVFCTGMSTSTEVKAESSASSNTSEKEALKTLVVVPDALRTPVAAASDSTNSGNANTAPDPQTVGGNANSNSSGAAAVQPVKPAVEAVAPNPSDLVSLTWLLQRSSVMFVAVVASESAVCSSAEGTDGKT
jgi:hypothetical protein